VVVVVVLDAVIWSHHWDIERRKDRKWRREKKEAMKPFSYT